MLGDDGLAGGDAEEVLRLGDPESESIGRGVLALPGECGVGLLPTECGGGERHIPRPGHAGVSAADAG